MGALIKSAFVLTTLQIRWNFKEEEKVINKNSCVNHFTAPDTGWMHRHRHRHKYRYHALVYRCNGNAKYASVKYCATRECTSKNLKLFQKKKKLNTVDLTKHVWNTLQGLSL